MSRKRLPKDSKDVLLVVHYQDGFCTVQATWDKVLFPIEDLVAGKGMLFKGSDNNVYLIATKNSTHVSKKLGMKIAEMWLNGEYMVVEPPLLPNTPQRDWLG